jgi:hypothetical protein
VSLFVVSPKLAHAGQRPERALVPDALTVFAGLAHQEQAVLKIVCRNADDVLAACQLADGHGFLRDELWVMPEGVVPAVLLARGRVVADAALACRVNFTTRLHILLWNDARGR